VTLARDGRALPAGHSAAIARVPYANRV